MPRTKRLCSALAVLCAAAALPACSGAGSTDTPPGPDPGDVVFFDDFAGTELDRSRWNVVVSGFWVNNEQQAYIDASEVIRIVHGEEAAGASNGALMLQAWPRPGFVTAEGREFDFVSGRINTRGKVEFTYGTAAGRIRLPAGSGLWPAFWVLGTGPWPETGEIDIMEFVGEREWVSSALHGPGYSGDTPLVARHSFDAGEDATGWHVYAVDWTPESLTFRVDGVITYQVVRAEVERYGAWAFDNRKFLILNLALGGAYPMAVNGVEAPYPGLPESTVRLIGEGQARMLIDWVRVTRGAGSSGAAR